MLTRKAFIGMGGCALGSVVLGAENPFAGSGESYSVAILGDTHYDTEPESIYHAHYDESNRDAKVQHEEFRRNGEMWRERCPRLLKASAKLAAAKPTDFVLQLGDIIQGDCDDVATHTKMLADCIACLRKPYPAGLPFLTVVGNHDIRGKGAYGAYFDFANPYLSKELGVPVKYPVVSFRKGPDLWVLCNFEVDDLMPIVAAIERDPSARYVFLVTHGPFTAAEDSFPAWRLGGRASCDASRPKLYEVLSRRHAIVLSGHTHTTAWYRHENEFGGFCEYTGNSVWKAEDLASKEPLCRGAGEYGKWAMANLTNRMREFEEGARFFRAGLKDYFMNKGAGHSRLNVSPSGVEMEFYPGDTTNAPKVFEVFWPMY